jgi:hypothetical protein
MRHFILLLLVAGTTSCASSGSTRTGIAAPTERVVATDGENIYRTTVRANPKVSLPVAPSRAFEALKAVYAELGIPQVVSDAATGQVGNTNFTKSRQLAAQPISSYLDCGDSLTGPSADIYRIYMSLVSVVRPAASGTSELETAFQASGQNMSGAAAERVACTSTGRFEERIQRMVLIKTGAAPQ